MLKGGIDGIPLGEGGSQLEIQLVELIHLLQSELWLAGPVCGNVPSEEENQSNNV